MKIAKAMKIISRLKGEINLLEDRIGKCVSTIAGNDFTEDMDTLVKTRLNKVEELVTLKVKVMEQNIKHGTFRTITTLSELKNEIVLYKDLEIKVGITKDRYGEAAGTTYKTQLDIATKEAHITKLQERINSLTDELDVFNATTEIN